MVQYNGISLGFILLKYLLDEKKYITASVFVYIYIYVSLIAGESKNMPELAVGG